MQKKNLKSKGEELKLARVRYALLSVADKIGIVSFAKGLSRLGFKILASGGTGKVLKAARVKIIDTASITGFTEILGGRVKTIHPAIYAGILARREINEDMETLKAQKISPIDMVVCNLYPFEEVISRPKFTHAEAVENIDIGGPTMVRAAAKNYKDVAIIVDPKDYKPILKELKKNKGELGFKTKERLSLKAFRHTERYDAIIVSYFKKIVGEEKFPKVMDLILEKIQELRYGENPHQQAAFYKIRNSEFGIRNLTEAKQLHGKELSFNNILDLDAAWTLVNYFADPVAAIIKHTNPCGAGKARAIFEAYKKAYDSDPTSAFGGIVGSNRVIDEKTAKEIAKTFIECVIAPGYDKKALKILKQKKNLRVIELSVSGLRSLVSGLDYKKVSGGFLVQDLDTAELSIADIKVVTKKEPTLGETEDMFFAWGVMKHVKSNAIVVVKSGRTLGIGAGQMSRIESAEIALKKAGKEAKGAVLASDGFFPFRDTVDLAAKAGISVIIQPGGSVRDEEVIKAANEHKVAMVFTGRRHFKH